MGVSVRVSRNTRVYLPWLLAIPFFVLWLAAAVVYVIGWSLFKVAMVAIEAHDNRVLRKRGE